MPYCLAVRQMAKSSFNENTPYISVARGLLCPAHRIVRKQDFSRRTVWPECGQCLQLGEFAREIRFGIYWHPV